MTRRHLFLFQALKVHAFFGLNACGGAERAADSPEPSAETAGAEGASTAVGVGIASAAVDDRTAAAHHPHHHAGGHHGFADAERFAAVFDHPERAEWQRPEEVIELLALEPSMRVVDLGAGTGFFLPYLSAAVGADGAVIALDTESAMIDYLTQRIAREELANVRARRVAPSDPELEPGSVDRILIVDTWHHVEDRSAYAARLAGALAPSGRLMIVDFTMDADPGPPIEMRLAPETVRGELESAGFRARILEEDLPHQYIVLGTL